MMQPYDFTWIFGVGMVAAFADAFGIGANDVANSFATSVSSGSLTLAQACIIACFTEFLGALLLGAGVSDTIKSGIVSTEYFTEMPEMFMFGMLCALIGSATWVLIASRLGWPVSTTHSIVGAVCGIGIAGFGGNAVDWSWNGIIQIVVSWFISPIFAGIVAAIIYLITKYAVLRQVDSVKWGLRLVPLYIFITVTIIVLYICFKAPGAASSGLGIGEQLGIAFGCGVACGIIGYYFLCPWLRRKVVNREKLYFYHIPIIHWVPKRPTLDEVDLERTESNSTAVRSGNESKQETEITEKEAEADSKSAANVGCEDVSAEDVPAEQEQKPKDWKSKLSKGKDRVLDVALAGVRKDVRNIGNSKLAAMHAAAELYEDDAEYLFSFLQVLTAIVASFAHGSNDVANAVGPLSAIYEVWQTATISSEKVPVPIWVLAYGGAAIDLGLATMGWRLMRSLGNNITYITPSRGFAAELGAALTVLTCSQLNIPVSTTHCIAGATAAVGLCNGNFRAVNWKMLALCMLGWILTLPCAGLVAGLWFAFATYGPSFVYLR